MITFPKEVLFFYTRLGIMDTRDINWEITEVKGKRLEFQSSRSEKPIFIRWKKLPSIEYVQISNREVTGSLLSRIRRIQSLLKINIPNLLLKTMRYSYIFRPIFQVIARLSVQVILKAVLWISIYIQMYMISILDCIYVRKHTMVDVLYDRYLVDSGWVAPSKISDHYFCLIIMIRLISVVVDLPNM